jgi:hypothetical protein
MLCAPAVRLAKPSLGKEPEDGRFSTPTSPQRLRSHLVVSVDGKQNRAYGSSVLADSRSSFLCLVCRNYALLGTSLRNSGSSEVKAWYPRVHDRPETIPHHLANMAEDLLVMCTVTT